MILGEAKEAQGDLSGARDALGAAPRLFDEQSPKSYEIPHHSLQEEPMTTFIRTLFVACLLLGLSAPFAAGQDQDAEGSKDHPLISRYPGSFITRYLTKEFDEFTLPLGPVVDQGKFSKSQPLEGKITRIVYVAPQGRTVLEVFRNYQGALKKGGFETLFTCGPQGCGSSIANAYANSPDNQDYWGPEHGIRYISAKLARPEGDVYVSLLIDDQGGDSRANTELYLIEVKPMESDLITVDAATLANDINRTGHASVYGIYFDTGKADVKPESDATMKEIAKLLQGDPKLKLYVVGHTDNQGALDMNMDLSRRRADAVLAALTSKYAVPAGRLRSYGCGPYSPVASNDSEEGRAKNRRVELVKQ
jgi:outer membrane protein OmpA-like peptidoglycan-associated protein